MGNKFVDFMASPAGRITRVAGGVVLIALGLIAVGGFVGIVLALVGLVPLLAGAFDVCLVAPLFGQPMAGKVIRGETDNT